ncbi:Mpo1-like protein [Aliikangiella sp. IMCC44359]|uniref:Mpo1-like protein n=1 Tax=Aliikangiella sp. IMCC44359 TaxID=3459125 RepID=UPI00403AD1D7
MKFFEELQQQRWDDHRFYHHNRVNQFLHLISASCFLTSYVLIFIDPVVAVLIGWLLAMVLRQIGHFFFEPKTYDQVNQASHEYKESVKVGYNLKRKIILLTIWVIAPFVLYFDITLFGMFDVREGAWGFAHNMSLMWLFIGIGAVLFRTVHLFFIMGIQSGLVWFTKILTDPFHDIKIYHKSPYFILKGDMYDDMSDWYQKSLVGQKANV